MLEFCSGNKRWCSSVARCVSMPCCPRSPGTRRSPDRSLCHALQDSFTSLYESAVCHAARRRRACLTFQTLARTTFKRGVFSGMLTHVTVSDEPMLRLFPSLVRKRSRGACQVLIRVVFALPLNCNASRGNRRLFPLMRVCDMCMQVRLQLTFDAPLQRGLICGCRAV